MIEDVAISSLIPDPSNARKHSKKNLDAIKGSLARFGQQKPVVIGADNVVIAGNGTFQAAIELGWKTITVIKSDLAGTDRTAYAIADNRTGELAEWDDEVLAETLKSLQGVEFDLGSIGFDEKDLGEIFPSNAESEKKHGSLQERFLVPPFSVLDARQGYWQDRKRSWLSLGIQSELGRGWGDHLELPNNL